jgi:hypothetical protein
MAIAADLVNSVFLLTRIVGINLRNLRNLRIYFFPKERKEFLSADYADLRRFTQINSQHVEQTLSGL